MKRSLDICRKFKIEKNIQQWSGQEVKMDELKLYGYARVSTREQNEDRQRIALMEMGVPKNRYTWISS